MKRTALFLALLTLALTLLPGCTPPEEDPAALAPSRHLPLSGGGDGGHSLPGLRRRADLRLSGL